MVRPIVPQLLRQEHQRQDYRRRARIASVSRCGPENRHGGDEEQGFELHGCDPARTVKFSIFPEKRFSVP